MSLSYYFSFTAPAAASSESLAGFLREVEKKAQGLGFHPTMVLNATFDTTERRKFARRLTTGFALEDERLKGIALPADPEIWEHNPHEGSCHLLPVRGVVLVVTDDSGAETAFGFFQYSEEVKDVRGRVLAQTGLQGQWHFSDFVDSPDPRYRELVKVFAKGGYLKIRAG